MCQDAHVNMPMHVKPLQRSIGRSTAGVFCEFSAWTRFKIQNSFIASHETYYDIQHRHI